MIGIIILNYNTPDDTVECINSITETTSSPYKIYLVDNASTDDSVKIFREKYGDRPDIVLIENIENEGYSSGNLVGINRALQDEEDFEYFLISNPDVIYYDQAIDILKNSLENNQDVGVVGPSQASLDQPESQLLRKVYTPLLYFFSKKPMRYLSFVFPSLKTEFPYPQDGKEFKFKGMVRGSCFLASKSFLEKYPLFDKNIFLYSEEWVIAKSLEEANLYCMFVPKAKTLHKEGTATKQKSTGFKTFHLYLSAFYYLKYYTKCSKLGLNLFFLQNIVNYFILSLENKDYRKMFSKFVITNYKLLTGSIKKIPNGF